jgi:hypothetical protein
MSKAEVGNIIKTTACGTSLVIVEEEEEEAS